MPPAPGLVSITIGWPTNLETLSRTTRAVVSEALPAGNGLMTLIGRVGQSSAAAAEAASSSTAPSTPANGRNEDTGISYSVTSAERMNRSCVAAGAPAQAQPIDSSFRRRLNRGRPIGKAPGATSNSGLRQGHQERPGNS